MGERGIPNLSTLYLYITDYCNLRCRHCWVTPVWVGRIPPPKLPLQALKGAIGEAVDEGLSHVKLTGGEPLLHPEFSDMVRFIHELGLSVGVETNGTLVTEGIADLLCDVKANISVSIDGADSETHDLFRGVKGSFEKTVRAVEMLRDRGSPPLVIFSVYRKNMEELEKVVELCKEIGVRALKVNPITPMGRGKRMGEEGLLLDIVDLLELKEKGRRLSSEHGIRILVDLPCSFDPLRSIAEEGFPTCPFLNLLSILADGDVTFCGFGYANPWWIMGNIMKDSIKKIWRSHPLLWMARDGLPGKLKGVCGKCMFKARCLGKCRAAVIDAFDDMFAPDPHCQALYERGLFPISRLVSLPER